MTASTRRQDAAAESLEAAKQVVTGATTEAPESKAKRTRSDGALAGTLWQRLNDIDAEEAAELAASPETIAAKHEGRRARAMGEASESVRALVKRMRGEDEGPRSE